MTTTFRAQRASKRTPSATRTITGAAATVLTSADHNRVITLENDSNNGAQITLPQGTPKGIAITFVLADTTSGTNWTIVRGGSETINGGSTITEPTTEAIGDTVTVLKNGATTWLTVDNDGPWVVS